MYFSKKFLLYLYKKLSSLYSGTDIEAQGGTQFVSELKYFLATDYFKKQKGKACDTKLKDDKDFFVSSVGKIVLLTEDGSFLATKNFANSVGEARDFDVGSNFFSANAVAKSRISTEPQKFPNRHPQLLSITKGVVDTYSGGYENFATDAEYFGRNQKKYAILFLWLNRFSNFTSKESVYTDSLFNLKKDFSSELISVLKWESSEVKSEVENLLTDVQLTETKSSFEKGDFSKTNETVESFSTDDFKCIKIPELIDLSSDRKQIKQNLIAKLNEIESSDKDDGFNLLSQLVLFGIQNGKIITENDISPNELASESNISDNYHQHLRFGIQIYNHAKNNHLIENMDKSELLKSPLNQTISPVATSFTSPEQIIYYGVPGSGKSHEIKHKLENEYKIPEQQQDVFVERTVFHPEYTNADFIGQIVPKLVQGKTDFVFKPGPFTSILKKALCDSQNRYVLIIEEINRGNAAAIFGELFQLLDRIDDASKKTSHEKELNTYGKGWSEYFVMNSEINNYIRDTDDTFDGKAFDINGIHFSANTGIRLPPNLSILATMNTSDQNVFTLDNAFQRRWDMKLIENVFGNTEEENHQKGAFVDTAKNITWEKFQTAINIKIGKMSEDAGLSSMEDKRLGCWFVKAVKQGDDYIISKDLFAEKVLKYLWDDAFKFCREKVFNNYTNLESLTRDFKGDKEFAVFKDLFSETEN
ncbi:MAG: AAA family ATPase [Treponema sp.]|nr:AAA family ATPase [Treponema sp.]